MNVGVKLTHINQHALLAQHRCVIKTNHPALCFTAAIVARYKTAHLALLTISLPKPSIIRSLSLQPCLIAQPESIVSSPSQH